ncbi:Ppx/GppA family phosphatase [Bacillus sp. 2205SS5-2]|uniref:Ppx/GppA family phosphatase n=1 Tax=Bacillus sp. 2205SS5-2 TaxID=3109031 RepID=UPI0030070C1C
MNKSAIVDIGSNTIRLVIYEYSPNGSLKEKENVKAVARLRTYLDEQNNLTEKGKSVLISILFSFKDVIQFHGVETVRCVATATIRQAVNADEIVKEIRRKTGFTIEILSEEEEAYFGFKAAVHSTSMVEGISIDIGGGSTEITYFKDKVLVHTHSYPFGVVSLKHQFIKGNQIGHSERECLQDFLISQFNQLPWLRDANVKIVAIGGSARNVAQIDQQKKNYPIAGVHQYEMNLEDIGTIRDEICSLTYDEIEKIEGLTRDRADIIIPAIEVFYQLFSYSSATSFLFSRNGLRDGLLIEENEDNISNDKIEESSIKELAYEYSLDYKHGEQMVFLTRKLWEELAKEGYWDWDEEDSNILQRAAFLYYLGEYIDSDSSSQHTFYILANRSINGFSHKKRVQLALLSSFKNKSTLKQYLEPFEKWFEKDEIKKLKGYGPILKTAYSLNATKRNVVKDLCIKKTLEGDMLLTIYTKGDLLAEKYQFEKQKRHLEKFLKCSITLDVITT